VDVVVEHRPRQTLDTGILLQGAQAVEKVLFARIVQGHPHTVDSPRDYMMEGAGCVDL